MQTMSAREAKNAFGLKIDTARADAARIEKHRHGLVMVILVEERERLHGNATSAELPPAHSAKREGTGRA